jgi:peptide/nickel transport system ATP-binding protein
MATEGGLSMEYLAPVQADARPLLRVENLSVSIPTGAGDAFLVRGVSLTVNPGEIVGIVGESGSGKSMTCRAIAGLLPTGLKPAGSVSLDGRELTSLTREEWCSVRGSQIGMIFQNPSSHLDPLQRIGQQIATPLRRHEGLSSKLSWGRAVALLRDVGIRDPEQASRAYPHQYSGGMKQRAMIAAAIGPAPRLLIADEPTTALDVTVQARILDLLRDLNRQHGLGIIFVSHDLGVIAEICDRVVVMRHGEIVEQRSTQEVINHPSHPYTKLLINSQPSRRPASQNVPARDENKPVIEIRDLTVEFKRARASLLSFGARQAQSFRALDQVSLSLYEGETIGIVGESGSGKSTLARAIVGLNMPAAGEVLYKGAPVHAMKGQELLIYRRAVQMIFQSPYDSLNPRLTVEETIAEPLARHALVPKSNVSAEVARLLDSVELPRHFANRRAVQLSGGQCQRVGIARALAMSPRILIADEITSALDVTTQAQVLDLLQRLKAEQGLTLIYISHDLAVVNAICERVMVFNGGRLVETGPVRSVMISPVSEYTKELIRAVPALHLQRTANSPPAVSDAL